jgi:hypothetical protein
MGAQMQTLGASRRNLLVLGLALASLAGAALALYLSAPRSGDFAWSDAPRHALNGIFVLDLLRDWPWDAPRQWAEDYYLRFPALSILFYPPLFSALLALAYSLFGFSHATAQGLVSCFHLLLLAGTFVLARRWLPPAYAVGAALALGAAPEVAYWGRQVMLDIPAYAWLVWAAVCFLRWLDTDRPRWLYGTLALYLAALYTKQTVLFAALPMLIALLERRGLAGLANPRVALAVLVFGLGLIPLALLQGEFGGVNTASALGSARDDLSRASLAAWTYYAALVPRQLGWPVAALAVVYLAGVLVRPAWRIPRGDLGFLLAWLAVGYLFFSFIMVREPRHDLTVLLPLPIFAALALRQVFAAAPERLRPLGGAAALLLGTGSLVWSILAYPPQVVSGYRELALLVAERSPPRSWVLFSGYRDGAFIFNLRHTGRGDLGVLRADKLLLRVAIERERGVEVVAIDRAGILEALRQYRVRYVVAQEGFWTDLRPMAELYGLLADESLFERVTTAIPQANFPNTDKRVSVYRFLGELAQVPAKVKLDMVGIGRQFSQ